VLNFAPNFSPIFIPNHTQAVGEIWVYIEFIIDSLPTLRIYESIPVSSLSKSGFFVQGSPCTPDNMTSKSL